MSITFAIYLENLHCEILLSLNVLLLVFSFVEKTSNEICFWEVEFLSFSK